MQSRTTFYAKIRIKISFSALYNPGLGRFRETHGPIDGTDGVHGPSDQADVRQVLPYPGAGARQLLLLVPADAST